MIDSNADQTVVFGGPTEGAGRDSRTSGNALPIGTRLSEFEIVGLVGEGGFGIVYLADDHSLHRRVAVKEYMPASLATRALDSTVMLRSEQFAETFAIGLRSFVNEARLLAQFDHPSLVKVHRFWEANGTAYMAMPYFSGKTLKQALKDRSEAPDEAWIRNLLSPLMDALELIHHENCFHRDIAPDNIMLLADGRPVLLDFGAARRVIGDMTQALTVILKPGYAPIEQYAEIPGARQGAWTDIYALAAVVYLMITGHTPPPSVGRMMQDDYQPLAHLVAGRYSEVFLRGIDRCLSVKGGDRPQSIAEMRELLGFTASVDGGASPVRPEPHSGLSPRPVATRADGGTSAPPFADVPPDAGADLTVAAASPATTKLAPESPPNSPAPATEGKGLGLPQYMVGAVLILALAVGLTFYLREPSVPSTTAQQEGPPAVQPLTSSPPTTRARVSLDDAFAEALAGSDSAFALKLSGVKSPLRIGHDRLSFALRSERGGYLNVLLWDKAGGHVSLIFPNDLDRDNHIGAGETLSFPRPEWSYEADAPAGDWDILTIVSASPRDFTSLGFSNKGGTLDASQDGVEAALNRSDASSRSITGSPRCASGAPCPANYAALRFLVQETEKRR